MNGPKDDVPEDDTVSTVSDYVSLPSTSLPQLSGPVVWLCSFILSKLCESVSFSRI
jgi:hypothetical protein